MAEPVPAWKFYHPLPLWQVFVIGLVAQIVFTIPIVALRELFGIGIPQWVAGGLGGFGMFVGVRMMAARKLAADAAKPPP